MSDKRPRTVMDIPDFDQGEEEDHARPRTVTDIPDFPEYEETHVDPRQAPAGHTPESRAWYEHLLGGAISAGDGALHHFGGEAARGMAHVANAAGVGPTPDEAERMVDGYARDYPALNSAGQIGMSTLAAGRAAATGVAQSAVGGATAGLAEYGRSGDLGRSAVATGAGAMTAGAGAWMGSKLSGLLGRGAAPAAQGGGMGPQATQAMDPVALRAAYGNHPSVLSSPPSTAPSGMAQHALQLGKGVLQANPLKAIQGAYGMAKSAGPGLGKLASASGPGSQAGAITGNALVQGLADSTSAQAQPDKAYATPAVFGHVLRVTVSDPQSGLPPEDAQALQEASASGDVQQAAALDYQYRQRYPAYARAMEKRFKALNGDE